MTTATYTRSGTTVTVTSPDHNLVVGDVIYADFTTGGALDGTYTITAVSGSTFTFSTVASGTITTSNVNWLRTESATYSQTGTVITVTKTSHGYAVGKVIGLAFVGSNAPADKSYTIETVPTANTFTVAGNTSVNGSGGVQIFQVSQFASYVFSTSARTPTFDHTRLAQVAAYAFSTAALSPNLTLFQGQQFAAYKFTSSSRAPDLTLVTQAQSAAYQFIVNSRGSLGKLVEMSLAPYVFTLTSRAPELSSDPQDFDLAPARATATLTMTGSMLVSKGQETVTSALDHLATLCGFQYASQCPADLQRTFMAVLNKVMIAIYARSAKLAYFNKTKKTVTLSANATLVTLTDDVLALEGYIRLTGSSSPIPTVRTQSEIDRYTDLYPGSTGPCQACYPQRLAREHAEGFTHTLIFSPAPTVDTSIDVDVLLQAPRYAWADYLDQTALKLPHRAAVAIAFPLLAKAITYSLNFANVEALPQIEADYQEARTILGALDLAPIASAPDESATAKANA